MDRCCSRSLIAGGGGGMRSEVEASECGVNNK